MKERIAIVDGIRTPFVKVGMQFKGIQADELGVYPIKEIMARTSITHDQVDEVIIGNVAQPSHAANIARVLALRAGFPNATPAYTVHRNCASGMESISTAANKILAGEAEIIVAGGTESMSNIPLFFNRYMVAFFEQLSQAKTLTQRLAVLSRFRLHFLKPVIGVVQGLTDPVCGLIMGLTAENLAREFGISREEQDEFALDSHRKAIAAMDKGLLAEEIMPVPLPPKMEALQQEDAGMRKDQSLDKLAKLKPYFDRKNGTVTVGNACPLTDGAAAVIVMTESKAKAMGLPVMGYLRDYAYAGLEPERMGLGPVYSADIVLQKSGLTMKDIDLVELNEAFAAQVIANVKAFESEAFAKKYLNKNSAVGKLDPSILNVNGGAIALGHPVGTTGTRLVITLLKELKRRGLQRGLATLCIGGGQGGSFILEVE